MRRRTPETGSLESRPVRGPAHSVRGPGRVWAGVLALLTSVLWMPACSLLPFGASAGDDEEPLPVAVVETLNSLSLAAQSEGEGVVTALDIEVQIEPKTPGLFRILGRGPRGRGVDDALIQLTVAWKDFAGTTPTSFGGRRSRPTAFGDDGEARFGQPFRRRFLWELDPAHASVLARRVEAHARLHPVDVVGESVRSGGVRMEFPSVSLESFSRPASGTLAEWFEQPVDEREPDELFLRAAQAPVEHRVDVIVQLVGQLAGLKGQQQEAGFGALHFMTGQTHGRSAFAWEAWLKESGLAGTLEP